MWTWGKRYCRLRRHKTGLFDTLSPLRSGKRCSERSDIRPLAKSTNSPLQYKAQNIWRHTLFAKPLVKLDKIKVWILWEVEWRDDVALVIAGKELSEPQRPHPLPQYLPAVLVAVINGKSYRTHRNPADRCQHYRFRAVNPFRAPSRFSDTLLYISVYNICLFEFVCSACLKFKAASTRTTI